MYVLRRIMVCSDAEATHTNSSTEMDGPQGYPGGIIAQTPAQDASTSISGLAGLVPQDHIDNPTFLPPPIDGSTQHKDCYPGQLGHLLQESRQGT